MILGMETPEEARLARGISGMKRAILFVRVVLTGIAFTSFWVGGFVLVVVGFPIARWRHRRDPPMERAAGCQRWVQRAYTMLHDFMRISRLINFNPRRVDPAVPGPRYVMVANHPTLVDVCALGAVYGRLTCIAKTALFRTPVVGSILRGCAYLDSGAGDVFSAASVVGQALDRLSQSMPVLVFPEGTRSPTGNLRPFARGAFEISCRANVPLLPVLITCDPPALEKGRPWYDIPKRSSLFQVTSLPVMYPAEFGGDAASMARACEGTYRRHLGLPGADSANFSQPAAMS